MGQCKTGGKGGERVAGSSWEPPSSSQAWSQMSHPLLLPVCFRLLLHGELLPDLLQLLSFPLLSLQALSHLQGEGRKGGRLQGLPHRQRFAGGLTRSPAPYLLLELAFPLLILLDLSHPLLLSLLPGVGKSQDLPVLLLHLFTLPPPPQLLVPFKLLNEALGHSLLL